MTSYQNLKDMAIRLKAELESRQTEAYKEANYVDAQLEMVEDYIKYMKFNVETKSGKIQ